MDIKKYGKLPSAQYDVLAYNKKRRALYLKGIDYFYGRNGRAANDETAYQLIKRSADMNDPYAIASTGSFYLSGKIVAQDYSAALKIYEEMYERLNPNAAYNVGIMHKKGLGTEIDFEMAKKCFADSLAFAAREACRNDELGFRFFREAFNLSPQLIAGIIALYLEKPICELCHGVVPNENVAALSEKDEPLVFLKKELLQVIDKKDYKRGKPVINIGFCCFRCEQLYVKPIREAIENGSVSKEEVALLEHRDDLIDALNTFFQMD